MLSTIKRLALVSSLVVVAGITACAEDLTLVNAAWATASGEWQKAIGEAKKAGDELDAKAKALAPIAAEDAAGTELKGKFDTALAGHKTIVTDLEKLVAETQTAIDAGVTEKKIAPVQAAIDAGSAKWTALAPKVAEAATAATTAFDALKAHADAAAAKAAADAAAAADPAAKDAETVKTVGGEATFALVFTDKNVVDEPASAAVLERLKKFLGACEGLKVDVVAGGGDEKVGATRAAAVKKLGKNIVKATGSVGEGVVVKVAAACQ